MRAVLEGGDDARFPLWQLSLAAAVAAIVLTSARLWEYPEPRPEGVVVLDSGASFSGTYVASDSDKILIRVRPEGEPPQLVAIGTDEVRTVRLWKNPFVHRPAPSLLDHVVHAVAPSFELTCIPPECRWDRYTRIGPSSVF
jgi:hypothetical protein